MKQNIICILIFIACLRHQCPTGSECRVCETTNEPYCVYSCAIVNGGCAEGQKCIEMTVPTCNLVWQSQTPGA